MNGDTNDRENNGNEDVNNIVEGGENTLQVVEEETQLNINIDNNNSAIIAKDIIK